MQTVKTVQADLFSLGTHVKLYVFLHYEYIFLFYLGTVYIEEPNSQKLIISGGTETVLTSSVGIPQPLEKLSIDGGATVKIEFDLAIGELLWSETSSNEVCKLIIAGDSTLNVSTLGDEHKGVSCNIQVDHGSTLSGDMLFVTGASPHLDVSGTLTLNSLTINNKGTFNVASTATLNLPSLTLSAWSVTDMHLESKFTLDSLSLGYNAEVKFYHDLVELELVHKFKMESGSKLTMLGTSKNVKIIAPDVTIQDSAIIDVSEGGDSSGPGAGSTTVGASHGGEGGGNSGNTYGSTKNPDNKGSGSTVQGGGTVTIEAATAVIDGNIISNGRSSSSGGSIFITATSSIEGHGYISASGGDGVDNGGGGGRIAINTQLFSSFHGRVVSYGGSGSSQPGAAGTIYEEYSQSGNTIKNIIVDNDNKQTNAVTHVSDVNDITELKILGKSMVAFDQTLTNPIVIRKITGNYSGVLTLQPAQSMEIATVYGTISPYALQCKLVIPERAVTKLPSKLLLKDDDTGSDWNNLEVSGSISNLQELVIAAGGRAIIKSPSKTGSEPVGTFSVNKLDVTTNGELFLATDQMDQYTLKVINGLNIKYGGTLTGRNLLITSTPSLQVAYNGLLNVDGGSQDGGTGNGKQGAGGSHGGAGGASEAGVEPATKYLGELHKATEAGSVGGDFRTNTGGFGGGVIQILEVTTLTLNGKISADGKPGELGGGGGSGGAISLTDIKDISGSGTFSVKGGTSDKGGGGGGGRVRLQVTGDMKFDGTYNLVGGSSSAGGSGGSGTASVVYKQKGVFGTVLDVFVDNSEVSGADGAADGKTFIDIPGETYSYVDNLNIGDDTTVHLKTENLHFKAKTLTCGTDSTVVVDENVIFSADTEQDYSVLHCSFDLYTSGELRFPASIELKGKDNHLKGNFIRLIINIFSLPGQSPGRAIALPPVLVSTFTLKFFNSLYFLDHLID